MKNKESLKRHLIIGILLIFLFTQGTFGLLNYLNLKMNFDEDVEEHSDALLSLVNANFEHFIETPVELISQMKGFIPQDITQENKDTIQTYISTIEGAYAFIDQIKVIDRDGNLVLQSPAKENLRDSNFTNESFFLNQPSGDEVLWTNIYLSELTHKPTIAMSVNLNNYLLVADLNLESLHTELFRSYSESVTTFSLIDQYGSYLYDNDHTKVEQRLSYPRFDKVKEISEYNTRFIFNDNTGRKMIIAKKLGVHNGGYLVVEQDYDHLQKDLNEFNFSLLISIAILFLISFMTITFLMKKIMKDFRLLSSHSKALSEGALDGGLANCQYAETQLIADDFNKMSLIILNRTMDVEHALNIAREASLAKGQFLANMSHEIRTPMNGILGMINVMRLSTLSDVQREYLATIHASTSTLMIILNDILDYSKIEAGKVTLRKELFSIKNALNDLKNLFISSAAHKEIDLEFLTDDHLPEYVLGDETRLRQVLSNLIGNAIKFTDQGGINISSRLVYSDLDQITIQFSIVDTGIGIAKVEQEHIFDRFEQGSNHSNAKIKGTGLGLAITKMLVELMDGRIELISDLNSGSTFIVEMPFEVSYEQHLSESEEKREIVQNKLDLRGINILAAEDDETSAFVMLTMLKNLGALVDVAENGKIAVEKANKKVYDLILMDVNMPKLDGLNATKQIRKLKMLNAVATPIPIIAITAFAAEGDRERCLSFGVDDYITKPVDFNVLYKKIHYLFEEGRMSAPYKIQQLKRDEKEGADFETIVLSLCEASSFDRQTSEYVIQIYITQTLELISHLKNLLRFEVFEQSLQEIGNLFHKLKGSSGNVRAHKIMQLASDAEIYTTDNNRLEIERILEEISLLITDYKDKIVVND